ncbi:MAG: VCBS repeat-containing protein [Myxococcales bacterium]|nr:VCBS repeat-containing protein [Myxococcales bacterium]
MPRPCVAGSLITASIVLVLGPAGCGLFDGHVTTDDEGFESDLGDSSSGPGGDASSGSTTATSSDGGEEGDCTDPCPAVGASACQGGGVATCVDKGDGCPLWSAPVACGDEEVCDAGACVIETSKRFGEAITYAVPEGGTASGGFARPDGVPEALGDDFWSLLDIDGDHRLDLVVTARAVSKQGDEWWPRTMGYPNAPYWEVYRGESDGFASKPIAWPVPSEGRSESGLVTLEGQPKIEGDAFWSLRDLDGDGRPDLVLTGRAHANGLDWIERGIGYPNTPYWEVYRNEGDGFAAVPSTWSVPSGGPIDRGYYVADGEPSELGDPKWETRDLDDDGYLDLVVTGKALAVGENGLVLRALGSLASPYWEVYRGGPEGFADTPEPWQVPVGGYVEGGFARCEATPESIGDAHWRLRDLDGDGLDDLVVTGYAQKIDGIDWYGPAPGFPDAPRWEVFLNRGDGFSRVVTEWALPQGGLLDYGYVDLAREAMNVGDQTWDTLDIDGDGRLELVITSSWEESQTVQCRGQVLGFTKGEPRWDVHESTEGGFTEAPWGFFLPTAGLTACGLRATAGQPLQDGDQAWITVNFEPDRFVDLVINGQGVGDPISQQVLGFGEAPHWLLYRGTP